MKKIIKENLLVLVLIGIEIGYYFGKGVKSLDMFFLVWTFIAAVAMGMRYSDGGRRTVVFSEITGSAPNPSTVRKNQDNKITRKYSKFIVHSLFIVVNLSGLIIITMKSM